MSSLFPENPIEAYGAATAALARADERVAMCANPRALLARLRRSEQQALALLEGEDILHDRLALEYGASPRAWRRWPHAFVQVYARALPAGPQPSADTVCRWLQPRVSRAGRAPEREHIEIYEDRLNAWERRCAAARTQPPLLAAADIAGTFARIAPLSRGNGVIAVMLGDRCTAPAQRFSAGGIAALGLQRRQIAWAGFCADRDDDDADDLSADGMAARRRHAWLAALAAGGDAVVALARAVEHWSRVVDEACATKRSSSRLRRVAELAADYPSLTPSRLAPMLGITRQGATLLLEQARNHRIVREVTHGNAFRRYVAAIEPANAQISTELTEHVDFWRKFEVPGNGP